MVRFDITCLDLDHELNSITGGETGCPYLGW
jgi:hypothetical protein